MAEDGPPAHANGGQILKKTKMIHLPTMGRGNFMPEKFRTGKFGSGKI